MNGTNPYVSSSSLLALPMTSYRPLFSGGEEAESLFREALAGFRQTSGRDHAHTPIIAKSLALLLEQQKRPREAELFAREAYAILQRTKGDADTKTIDLMDRLHKLLRQQDKTAEAQAVAEQALPALRASLGWDHSQTIRVTFRLLRLLREQRKYAAAQAVAGRRVSRAPVLLREEQLGPPLGWRRRVD